MKVKLPKVSIPKLKVSAPKLGLAGAAARPPGMGAPGIEGGGGRVRPYLHMASRLHLAGKSAYGPGSSSGSAFATPDQTPGPDAAFGEGDSAGPSGAAAGDMGE